jgi:hypothetical protein
VVPLALVDGQTPALTVPASIRPVFDRGLTYKNGNVECQHWQNSGFVDTLAAAYAEASDFEKALKYEKQALNDSSLSPREKQDRETRLALFQRRKPLRAEF